MAVRWKTLTVTGHGLRYAVSGDGPAVVLPKKDRGSYVPFERLAGRYTMIQIEPVGFGFSSQPDPHPAGGIHQQILAVCDAEGVDEFAVWGFSQGGAMAWAVAQATHRARLVACGGFHLLRGPSDAWIARMNSQERVPPGPRSFWNWFHGFDWHSELRRLEIPKLTYFGSQDAQRVPPRDQVILRALGVDIVEFPGLSHTSCGFADPRSPATEMVADWMGRNGWPGVRLRPGAGGPSADAARPV